MATTISWQLDRKLGVILNCLWTLQLRSHRWRRKIAFERPSTCMTSTTLYIVLNFLLRVFVSH